MPFVNICCPFRAFITHNSVVIENKKVYVRFLQPHCVSNFKYTPQTFCFIILNLQLSIPLLMRLLSLFLTLAVTVGLIILFDTSLVLKAPLGKLLSPQHGLWQNASNDMEQKSINIKSDKLEGKVNVYLDERLVPHVFAEKDRDAYFVQGYLHAKYRLWQMEFQTLAAAGNLSSVVGKVALPRDREFKRLGMEWSAEQSTMEMEKDPDTKLACDAYTEGVNEYIKSLSAVDLPIEYKLLGYMPSPWSNKKTMLFLKYMSYDLASAADDFEMTNSKSFFTKEQFALLYPEIQDSLDPIVPASTILPKPVKLPVAPAQADTSIIPRGDIVANEQMQPDRENGSNNWAVAGSKTASGYPILANDPHLGLNLPSLWFEMQINTPTMNVYGATFPGSPCVIIGFNDSCAFGFTNGGRDVRDYYEISFKDDSREEYLFNGTYHKTMWRIDTIKIKGETNFMDSVAYVKLGEAVCPVMYDKNFTGNKTSGTRNYAVRWTAHDKGNELKLFYLLDHAKNYADYTEAAQYLITPGQNIVFASKSGDIALRTQGSWPAKWKGQGDFIMPGIDSSFLWQSMIPQNETPFQYNPERAFVSSANQKPVPQDYRYYIGRVYPIYRGFTINRNLQAMSNITPQDMMTLQTNNEDGLARMILPKILSSLNVANLNAAQIRILDSLSRWDFVNSGISSLPTMYDLLWRNLNETIYSDEFLNGKAKLRWPLESTLTEVMLRGDTFAFYDNVNTQKVENLMDVTTMAFTKMCDTVALLRQNGKISWYKFNNVRVTHLARLAPFSRSGFSANGGRNSINANHGTHGPSWRMVVSLTPETEAWGIYPGGQSGNPASKYYDDFIPDWSAEKYYKLWVMKANEATDKRIQSIIRFSKN